MSRVTDQPFRDRSSDRRVFGWLLFSLLVLFGGLYAAAHGFTDDRVPRGTTVSGVEIGGMTVTAARARLDQQLTALARRPITVTANGVRRRVPPGVAGLRVDVPASLARVGAGRSWDPRRMWNYVAGGRDLDAVTRVDRSALGRSVAGLAADVDVPAREGSVTFADGSAVAHYPHDGVALDRPGAAAELERAFLTTTGPVGLPTEVDEPEITKADVSAAMDRYANPAVSAPVIYQIGGKSVVLRPADYTDALSMVARDGKLVLRLDEKRLLATVRPAMKEVSLAPEDATVELIHGRPQVVPGTNGVTFDPDDVTGSFLELVTGHDHGRQLAVKSVVAKPRFTTADARALRITERVSEFTTYFPHADYRNTNLGRAAELVNGSLLKPGDTFSLNRTVGERTARNGFTKGFIISDGVFKEDFGGGVSQVATTTFNAAFFAGLEDVEHKPHSFYIDRYPVGREATVAWPTVDLKFKNTTPYGVLVQAWIDRSTPARSGAMHVAMWSTKYWDIKAGRSGRYHETQPKTRHLSGDGCVPNQGYGGFDIDVYRYFYRHGSKALDHKETMHTTYTPSDSVVCS
jgi:vancomycin resistance protein YoaR